MTTEEIERLRCLLNLQWVKRNGETDVKQVDWIIKNTAYAVNESGEYINCCTAKPSIESTLYYDDETAKPATNFDAFKRYNIRLHGQHQLQKEFVKEYYCLLNNWHDDKTGGKMLAIQGRRNLNELSKNERPLTENEFDLINAKIAEVQKDYDLRLERYYKRYADKIKTSGYFANR